MRMRVPALIAPVLLVLSHSVYGIDPEAESPEGVILEIGSPAYLRTSPDAKPVSLDPKRDVFRLLPPGHGLRVGPGGKLTVRLASGTKVLRPSDQWFVVRHRPRLTPEQQRIADALRMYGTRGGTRGAVSRGLFLPANGAVVRSGHVTVKWNPFATALLLQFRLFSESGKLLWAQDSVDSGLLELDTGPLRRALTTLPSEGHSGTLLLVMTGSDGSEFQASFTLLTAESEAQLARDLAAWDSITDPVLKACGRAYEFSQHGLYAEAADETDNALSVAPDSVEIRAISLDAHRRLGNLRRVQELSR